MNKATAQLKPVPLWHTLVLFGVPGAIVYVNIYVVVPYLVSAGVPLVLCFPPLLMSPVLLPASLVLFKREGNEVSWPSLRERFRLHPIAGKQWLRAVGTLLAAPDIGRSVWIRRPGRASPVVGHNAAV